MSASRKSLGAAFAIAFAAGTVSVVAPTASAATDGSNVVINEVYGGGGNSGATYTHDFVELYNPTDAPIDLTGWTVTQRSTSDAGNGSAALSGSIPAKGYFLIQGAKGNGGTEPLPTPDAIGNGLAFGKDGAIARLIDSNHNVVDLVGWGGATPSEGSPAGKTKNSESVQRREVGVDSDNNASDFIVAEPTPQNSGNAGEVPVDPDPEDPADPAPQPEQPQPGEITPIAEIQGTGATTPFENQIVTTRGVVTAVYSEHGKNGFYIQTPGAGQSKNEGDASDAIFVYMNNAKPESYPKHGEYVEVTGTAVEFYSTTQLKDVSITPLEDDFEPVTPVALESLPETDAARERYEGMLLKPGVHTVTDNFSFQGHGEMGIVPGTEPLRQPTDFMNPGPEAYATEAEQRKSIILLDDAATYTFFKPGVQQADPSIASDVPLPYLQTSDQGIKSMRVGDQLNFKESGVILEYAFNNWRFQPLVPITGKSPEQDLPVTWADSREAVRSIPGQVQGDYSVGSFNVLNYFTSLGKDESGCGGYSDRFGEIVATNRCDVRGAFSQEAFLDQQAKIVLAISELDADVVGLMEIENNGDAALDHLVAELNKKDGDKWAHNGTGSKVGTDAIRVAVIYNKNKVEPVGDQVVISNPAFSTARQPVAQAFKPKGGTDDQTFVAVVNHFKSKGSAAKLPNNQKDSDTKDGQAHSAKTRDAQAKALASELKQRSEWADLPIFILGDLNSYSREDSIRSLEQEGYTLVENRHHVNGVSKVAQDSSYAYQKHVGSLDHILANANANNLVRDAAVWNINADEPIVFQYSRRNYFGADLFEADNPFAASDHDPVKVGFSFEEKTEDPTDPTDEPKQPEEDQPRYIVKAKINDAGELVVTYDNGDTENLGKVKGADGKDGQPGKDGTDGEQGPKGDKGDTGTPGKDGENGRGIANLEVNEDGELMVTYSDGETQNLGRVAGADGQDGTDGVDGKDGEQGQKGDKGDKGDTGAAGKNGVDGQDGKDGRGVKSFEVNDEGHLMVTYSDGETVDLGKVTGDATDGKNGVDGQDGKDGENGRGIANLEVNEDGELIASYTDGETQNLGRVVGADGTDGKDGQDGKPGKDGEKGEKGADGANAPADEGSSASDRCLPSVGIMALPLLALIPLGLAATADVPALAPVKEQLNKIGEQLPVPMDKAAPLAGAALAIAAIATLATLCSTEGGSSK